MEIGFLKSAFEYIAAIVGTALVIFAIYKIGIIRILKEFIVPKPIFNMYITKLIQKAVQEPKLVGVLKLYDEILVRFGSYKNIPVIIAINKPLNLKYVGKNASYYEDEFFSWCINEKLAVVYLKESEITSILPLLNSIFKGYIGQAVVIHGTGKNESITSIANSIFSVTKIICSIFFVYEMNIEVSKDIDDATIVENSLIIEKNSRDFLSLSAIFKESDSIGFFIQNYNDFPVKFANFIHENLNKLLHVHSEINVFKGISILKKPKEEIFYNIEQIEKSNMKLGGVFYMGSYENNCLFFENFYNYDVYGSCNNFQIINPYENSRNNKIFNFFLILSLIFSSVYLVFHLKKTKKLVDNIDTSLSFADSIKKNNYIHESSLLNHINLINRNNPNFFSNLFLNKYIHNINRIRNLLVIKSGVIFNSSNGPSDHEIYTSPMEIIPTLRDEIMPVLESFEDIYNFSKKAGEINMGEYEQNCRQKILHIFGNFTEKLDQFILLSKIKNLSEKTQILWQNANIFNLKELINEYSDLKILISTLVNDWWIEENLGKSFMDIMKKIKELPSIGHFLGEEVEEIIKVALKKIKTQIAFSETPLTGRLFNLEGKNLVLTNNGSELSYFLTLLSQEELIQLPINDMYYSIPEKDEFSFWNLDILEKIIQKINFRDDFLKNIKSYPLGLKNLANQMVNNSLFGFIKSNLCDAQKIIPNTLSIEEKTSNIASAIKKFDVIENFVTKTLNGEMPNFVTFLLSESIIKIINEFRASLENSIFTAYTNLNSWKGENLVSFLFQCSGDDLPFLVNKTISYLQYLHEKVLTPILPKLPQISKQDYLFVENISNEIKKYINGQKNIISVFENFINDLIRWKIEWQSPDIHFSSKEDFFNFHLKSFRKFLILNTNRIIFEQSCRYYNELVVFFNDRLAGKFPFGNLDNCNVLDLIKFLNMYSACRNHLKSDEEFKKKKLPISLNVLDDLMNFFVVENNNLYINVKIQYHLPEGKNTYLVKNYVSNFGEETYFSDFIDCQVKASKGFVLGISIINSSRWKIQITDSDLTTKLSSNMRFNFLKEFGFLYFIIENLSRIEDRNVFLKISIPLSTENGGEKSEMILVLKISNYPYFFSSMTLI